jgi:hypothetical protein
MESFFNRPRGPAGVILLGLLALAFAPAPAGAAFTTGFYNITSNNPADAATAGRYSVQVLGIEDTTELSQYKISLTASQVAFIFKNVVTPTPSSITDVYFQDGTLLSMSTPLDASAGVRYGEGGEPRVSAYIRELSLRGTPAGRPGAGSRPQAVGRIALAAEPRYSEGVPDRPPLESR